MRTLTVSRHDRRNTIIYGPDGAVLYEIQTLRDAEFLGEPTTIYRRTHPEDESSRVVVGQFDFHKPPHRLLYQNTMILVDEIFPKKRWPSSIRTMIAESQEYRWSRSSDEPQLSNSDKRVVVRYRKNFRTFGKSTPPTLEVDEEAWLFLDLVVLGWIVMSRDSESYKERNRTTMSLLNGRIAATAGSRDMMSW